ncbi:MAG: LCP family protein [Ilumatobacter sp.]|uniref:LCP family protein n=2 Tax=Ilumatobacter sp. TaxID=1967498 RepID=UPI0032986753
MYETNAGSHDSTRDRPRRRTSAPLGILFAVVVAASGSVGAISAFERSTGDIAQFEDFDVEELAPVDGPAVNYLLIGSDSREGVDPNAPDAAVVGDVSGRRSDTIMILRQEEDGNGAAILSLNRDLWVTHADTGRQQRINAAYNRGADVLAATITAEYGIPINHVVDINFVGFESLVEAIGGVTICFEFETRDTGSGLAQPPGCNRLDGAQALAYARGRNYEELRDGDWRKEPTADLGRVLRQQNFLRIAVDEALNKLAGDPSVVRGLLDAAGQSLVLDPNLDPISAAGTLKKAFATGLNTFTLQAEGANIDGNSVLLALDTPENTAVLDYFRGFGALPVPPTTIPG